MKITLTKFDVLKILIDHFGISHYYITDGFGKPEVGLDSNEIYWEGNSELDAVEKK